MPRTRIVNCNNCNNTAASEFAVPAGWICVSVAILGTLSTRIIVCCGDCLLDTIDAAECELLDNIIDQAQTA